MHTDHPWLSVVPPILAILGAVMLRNVYLALGMAILSGNLILLKWDVAGAFSQSLNEQIVRQIAPQNGDLTHLLILLFTLGTGGAVELMRLSQGADQLITKLSYLVKTRIQAQFTTWLMGLLVFFDDYANTMIVGTIARPLTDRFKISRAKLAYLIDTTSAPVAGLALISTWVGAELSYISDAYQAADITADPFGIFIATLPYRFYPWLALLFALLITLTGRDFGPMRRAELQANKHLSQEPAMTNHQSSTKELPFSLTIFFAILGTFIFTVLFGIFWTGLTALSASGTPISFSEYFQMQSLAKILSNCNSNIALLWGAFYSTLVGIIFLKFMQGVSFSDIFEAIFRGMSHMFPAVMILVLAWGIANICDKDHLQTANYLGTLIQGNFSAAWMPLVAFLLACIVSLTTGSSWSTMGLLIPLVVPIMVKLIAPEAGTAVDPYHPILLNTVGAILAGSIFGDHCSPISDTTVLSSAAAQCDHLEHVNTQYPYALAVGMICLAGGYLPLTQQLGLLSCWGICCTLMVGVILFVGKKLH